MTKKIAILANGLIKDKEFHKKQIQKASLLICADGGANHAKNLNLIPSYIIGDFDSINDEILTYFSQDKMTTIIENKDQDKTDLELALELAESLYPDEISIYAALGNRIDHTLANIYTLDKVNNTINTRIIDEKTTIKLIEHPSQIKGTKDDIISVISLSSVTDLNFSGLKWNVNNLTTEPGWFGVSNQFEQKSASISFQHGKILVIQVKE